MRDNREQGIVSSLIIFVIGIMILLAITGCSTVVPVTARFPEKPNNTTTCPQLASTNDNVKLSELTATVANNYSTYYECAVKVDTWNEWYETQKRIFEGVAK